MSYGIIKYGQVREQGSWRQQEMQNLNLWKNSEHSQTIYGVQTTDNSPKVGGRSTALKMRRSNKEALQHAVDSASMKVHTTQILISLKLTYSAFKENIKSITPIIITMYTNHWNFIFHEALRFYFYAVHANMGPRRINTSPNCFLFSF